VLPSVAASRLRLRIASPECSASNEAAEELSQRGFEHVFDYEGGLSDWKQGDQPVEGVEGAAVRD